MRSFREFGHSTPAHEWRWRPSRYLLWWVWAGHAAALAGVWLSGLHWLAATAASVALAASARHDWRHRHWSRAPGRIAGLRWRDERWFVLVGGDERAVEPLVPGVALPWLIAVRFQRADNRRVHSVVLLPDSMDADAMRRLRVAVRAARGR